MRDLSTRGITEKFHKITRVFGVPLSCRTDGGPQFREPFEAYCRSQGIKHETSSPYNPRSNGHAEAAVKAAKHLILKTSPAEFEEALTAWRNTARVDKPSPSEMLFGRKIRDVKAMALSHIKGGEAPDKPNQQIPENVIGREEAFIQGDSVRVQDQTSKRWSIKATVIHVSETGRTLDLLTNEGQIIRRNRRFVRSRCDHNHPSPQLLYSS